jgi:hypothetical protein
MHVQDNGRDKKTNFYKFGNERRSGSKYITNRDRIFV